MSVIKVDTFRYGYSGNDQSFVEQYIVTTDSALDTQPIVMVADGLPKIYDTHPDNNAYMVRPGGISASRVRDKITQWMVSVTYTFTSYQFNSNNEADNRLLSFAVDSVIYSKVPEGAYTKNIDGWTSPITSQNPDIPFYNSTAIEPLDPSSIQEEYFNRLLRFSQKEDKKFNYTTVTELQGSLNSEEVTVLGFKIAPKQGLLRKVAPEMQINEKGNPYWICHYEIEIAQPNLTHEVRVLDAGFKTYQAGGSETQPGKAAYKLIKLSDINDDIKPDSPQDAYLNEPWPLNGNGYKANEGDDPVYITFRTKPVEDWKRKLTFISTPIKLRFVNG